MTSEHEIDAALGGKAEGEEEWRTRLGSNQQPPDS
jgi:hypothetical protein